MAASAAVTAVTEEPRLALIIGNAAYRSSPLANPVNDVRLMEQSLKQAGFAVIKAENVTLRETRRLVREFGDRLKQQGGVGLFYFAGHGVQVRGDNYLVSVDSDIRNEDEVADDALNANLVLEKMQSAGNRVNLVILDACRNNPFAVRSRASVVGLATMSAPSGSMVAYSTSPGSVASDGNGQNGLYTQHLAKVIAQPGLTVEDVFKQVRTLVRRDSNNAQTPWENTALEGQFYFLPAAAQATPNLAVPAPAAIAAPTANATNAANDAAKMELSLWDTVKDSGSVSELKSYLERFPKGVFAGVAQSRINMLNVAPPAQASAAPAVAAVLPPTAPAKVIAATPAAVAATPAAAPVSPPALTPSAVPPVAAAPAPAAASAVLATASSSALANVPEREFTVGSTRFKGRFVQDASGQSWSGEGRLIWANGDEYEGPLVAGKRQGQGSFNWAEGRYVGNWVDDRVQGQGSLEFKNGNRYTGALVDGQPWGQGSMRYASGDTYQGSFVNGKAQGPGVYDWRSGQRYEGPWVADRPQGIGMLRFVNGNVYEGEVVDGKPQGQGVLRFASGDVYQGMLQNGIPHGQGEFVWKSGDRYTGQWKEGLKDGQGTFLWSGGQRWEGLYRNDQQVDASTSPATASTARR